MSATEGQPVVVGGRLVVDVGPPCVGTLTHPCRVAGVLWTPIGIAARAGLVLLMFGGVVAHLPATDPAADASPAAVHGAVAADVVNIVVRWDRPVPPGLII